MPNTSCEVPYRLGDGLGMRSMLPGGWSGLQEILEVDEGLAAHPHTEQHVRSRAAQFNDVETTTCARVHRIELQGTSLQVVADIPAGLRLSDVLTAIELGNDFLTDAGALELAAAVIKKVAALHRLPGALAHGALCPAHVVLTSEGTAVLTDGIFAPTLEAQQRNREQLWREFGVALPASAGTPRFDQRGDVTQLGALVLAILLRRSLKEDEYPRGVQDLVIAATPPHAGPHAPALRSWLEQALQLHSRAVFGSAVDAQQVFEDMLDAAQRRAGARAVQTLIRKYLDRAGSALSDLRAC